MSDRVRQFVLVKDQPIDPFNPLEHVQLLNEDGTIVDPTKDSTKLSWRGVWDPEAEYGINDMVSFDNKLWVANGALAAGNEPGDVDPIAPPTVVTNAVKAGNAMFGGTNHDAYLAVKGDPITAFPGPDPGITQNWINSCYIKLPAAAGEEVTLEWAGGPIALFDGQHGDQLFPGSGPLSNQIAESNSPLTFTVPAGTSTGPPDETVGGTGVAYVGVEVKDDVVTSFLWVDPLAESEATWELMPIASEGVVYKGVWNSSDEYSEHSMVKHDGGLHYAAVDLAAGIEPGIPVSDPLVATINGREIYARHRIASTTPESRAITADSVPSTFSNPYKSEPIYLHRTTSSHHVVTIYNDHPTANLKVDKRDQAGSQAGAVTVIAPGANATIDSNGIVSGTNSPAYIAYFNAGELGAFRVKVDSAAGLLAPPDVLHQWTELITAGGTSIPVGGTVGQILTKQSSTDGDADWEDPPSGGGGSSTPGLILDEKFDSGMAAFSSVVNITVASGYAKRTASGSAASFEYTAQQIRNPLIIAEISLDGTAGSPVLNIGLRRIPSHQQEMNCHDTNFHIYKDGTLITWSGHGGFVADGRRYWLEVGGRGPFLDAHFWARHPKTRPVNPNVNLDGDLSGDSIWWTGSSPDKQAPLGDINFVLGANVRLHRVQIYDLDLVDLWE